MNRYSTSVKNDDMRGIISEKLEKVLGRAKLPSNITFKGQYEKVEIILTLKAAGVGKDPHNMQTDEAAFEAWALFIHVHCGYGIQLSLAEITKDTYGSGHYHRFLYRALKFSEQYKKWFELSDDLAKRVEEFKEELFGVGKTFYNNLPKNEATTGNSLENIMESLFAKEYCGLLQEIVYSGTGLSISKDKIFRQLPVGLFKDSVEEKNRVFTGGKSAIDLWTTAGDSIVIFELKSKNKMAGIITELIFYANYMNDMYIAHNNFKPSNSVRNKESGKMHRGYHHLVGASQKFKTIRAYMLTDELHGLITDEVITEMNKNNANIMYGSLKYKYELRLCQKVDTI
jgi:hypothetical protein